ncbi:MAG: hypothetical protein ACRDFT_07315, partial [bacterium]
LYPVYLVHERPTSGTWYRIREPEAFPCSGFGKVERLPFFQEGRHMRAWRRLLLAAALVHAVILLPGRPAAGAADPTCGYMDRLKSVWNSTEPTAQEKAALRRSSERFQAGTGDRRELDVLDTSLASFGGKVQRRLMGTRGLAAPPAAAEVRRLGLDFLDKVAEVVELSRRLIAEFKAGTPDADLVERGIERLHWLDAAVQRVGTLFNREVVRVRGRFGCGPP